MHKLSMLVVFLALCTASHGYGYGARQLLLSSRAGGSSGSSGHTTGGNSASSSAGVTVHSSGGSASGKARSSSKAYSDARNALVRYCNIVYNEVTFLDYKPGSPKGQYCVSAYSLIDKYIKRVGKASADALVSTAAEVSVTGTGSACAGADATARSQAESYAGIVAEAVAIANNGKFKARAHAAGEVVSHILVQAYADSYSTACLAGEGYARAWHDAHAKAVGYPMAVLWIWLYADVDCRNEQDFVEVAAEGTSSVKTSAGVTSTDGVDQQGNAVTGAGGSGSATATTHCRNFDKLKLCCNRRDLRRGRCFCSRRFSFRNRQCNAKLEKGVRNVWYDDDLGITCHC